MAKRKRPVYCGLFDLRCVECGAYLVRAGSGAYLACPNGHGKLTSEEVPADRPPEEEPCGLWIEE